MAQVVRAPLLRLVADSTAGRRAEVTAAVPTGTCLLRERGLSVALAAFQADAAEDADALPLERTLAAAVGELVRLMPAQADLFRLWLRIGAVCVALEEVQGRTDAADVGAAASAATASHSNAAPLAWVCRAGVESAAVEAATGRLCDMNASAADWARALQGVAELDTSAPSEAWLLETMIAADALLSLFPTQAQDAVERVVGPLVAASPARAAADTPTDTTTDTTTTTSTDSANANDKDAAAAAAHTPSTFVSALEVLVVVAGQMNRNGYSVRAPAQPNVVRRLGLFPAVAMLNHSCAPNCAVVSCEGGVLEVRALRALRPGQELLVSYINVVDPRATRRAALRASKEFVCTCLRCAHPDALASERILEQPLCPRCHHNILRPAAPDADHDTAAPAPHTPADSGSELETAVPLRCFAEDGGCSAVVSAAEASALVTPLVSALTALAHAAPRRSAAPAAHAEALAALVAAVEESLRERRVAATHWALVAADCALAQAFLAGNRGPAEAQATLLEAVHAADVEGVGSCGEAAARYMRRAVAALEAVLPTPYWPELCGWRLRLGSLLLQLAAVRGSGALKAEAVDVLRTATAAAQAVCGSGEQGSGDEQHPLVAALAARLAEAEA